MEKEELLKVFPFEETDKTELIAQCAKNIKMMILDDFTKLPEVHHCTAISALCDGIYYWQRGNLADDVEVSFNLVRNGADQRFKWPYDLYFISASDVAVITEYRGEKFEDLHQFLVDLASEIVQGLTSPYEQRTVVPKNVYWEELFESNSLLLDFLPKCVIRRVFERDDEEFTSIEEHMNPHVGYLRLLHNAMAWINLYDELEERDLLQSDDMNMVTAGWRSQLEALLSSLWEPIDSLREYVQYLNQASEKTKQWLISKF